MRTSTQRAICPFAAVLLITGGWGCTGGGLKHYAVDGEVTLDGEPLEDGTILFFPASGDHDADVGKVHSGRFAIQATAGEKRVSIKATRLSHDKTEPSALGGPPSPVRISIIPTRYNEQTILRAEVVPAGPNHFHFDLETGDEAVDSP